MRKLEIDLSPEIATYISEQVELRNFESAEAFITEAISKYCYENELESEMEESELKEALAKAAAQIERGETFDGEEVMREAMQRLRSKIESRS